MIYDCSNPLDRENFLARAKLLADRGDRVDLHTKRIRTLKQNSYLHVVLAYFASVYGESEEFVKDEYFKRLVNEEFFVVKKNDRFRGEIKVLRSSTELTTEEMSKCIDRFRNWASKEAGIYIPSADEGMLIRQAEIEIAKSERYMI